MYRAKTIFRVVQTNTLMFSCNSIPAPEASMRNHALEIIVKWEQKVVEVTNEHEKTIFRKNLVCKFHSLLLQIYLNDFVGKNK